MPIIQVHMVEGRPAERKAELITALTETCCNTLGVGPEAVRIIISEMKPENYGLNGQPYTKK